ncbi:PrsW family glutamic-type intramembrane protease [Gammaproteobacteria bacterium]|nr:PrsW family glutamic-type intramembrane protease [Gammaproteobacteria bacterium]
MTISLLFFAIFPPLFLARYVYKLNTHGRLEIESCVRLLAYGGLTVIPILFVGNILTLLIAGEPLFTQVLVHALNEEIFKFLVIKHFIYDKKLFAAPIDGIVYAVMASLGFALVENILFVFSRQPYLIAGFNGGDLTAFVRMFTAIPMHTLAGVIMGYFLGRAKLSEAGEKQLIFKAVGSATLFHTVYNYTVDVTGTLFFPLIVVGIGFYFSKYLVQDSQIVDKMLEILSSSEIDPASPAKPSKPNSKYTEVVMEPTSDEVDVAPEFYEKAYNEIKAGETNSGIWAMAYAKSSSEEDAKKKYITLRALELAGEANKTNAKDEQSEIDGEESEIKNKQAIESEQEVEESEEELVKKLPDLIHWAEKNSYIVESDGAKHRIRKEPLGKFRNFDNDLSFVNHLRDLRSAKL